MAARGAVATVLRVSRQESARYTAACSTVVRPRAAALALGGAGRAPAGIAGQARSFHATAAQNSSFGGGGGDRSWHMGIIVVPQQAAYVSPTRALLARVCASLRACMCSSRPLLLSRSGAIALGAAPRPTLLLRVLRFAALARASSLFPSQVMERFGKFSMILEPGLNFAIPAVVS